MDNAFLLAVAVVVTLGGLGLWLFGTVDQIDLVPSRRRRVPAWLAWSVAVGVAVAWAAFLAWL